MSMDELSKKIWAEELGLVPVPLFSQRDTIKWDGSATVLLDGQRGSFAFLCQSEHRFPDNDEPLSWAWSSNLRHIVFSDDSRRVLLWRRWDSPKIIRKFKFPTSTGAAREFLELLERSSAPSSPDAIRYVLQSFRRLRETLDSDEPLDIILAFNAILAFVASSTGESSREYGITSGMTISDLLSNMIDSRTPNLEGITVPTLNTKIGDLILNFLRTDRYSGMKLMPSLLLRHASGQLYQEAHLLLEKDPQIYLPGMAPGKARKGRLTSGVRFTPQQLARFLVQKAFQECDSIQQKRPKLEILDPACGSGVFLIEAIRELDLLNFEGQVFLKGFDVSHVACAICDFCVRHAISEMQDDAISFHVDIKCENALTNSWGTPDVVLMNPPFMPWQHLQSKDKSIVRDIMGSISIGNSDIAMAFIWKAAQSIISGGTVGAVLPAPALDTIGGLEWRRAIQETYEVRLIGSFRGYGYFRESLVAPGFIIIHHPGIDQHQQPWTIRTIAAEDGSEDAAIRAARVAKEDEQEPERGRWSITDSKSSFLRPESWDPRVLQVMPVVTSLQQKGISTVGDLFEVHQGILTGHNAAFLISGDNLDLLPRQERRYFKPVASSKTIYDGVVSDGIYVFFPYVSGVPAFETVEILRSKCSEYYKTMLIQNKDKLDTRSNVRDGNIKWWELNRPRLEYNSGLPKFVSKSWGLQGAFALDIEGIFAVVQGHLWLWQNNHGQKEPQILDVPELYAYLALLNSPLFEALFSLFCPKVQGGQSDLAKRYVDTIPIPDLTKPDAKRHGLLIELSNIGRAINNRSFDWDFERHLRIASLAYRISYEEASELVGQRR